MDKLANYGSDDDYEESPKREKTEYQEKRSHVADGSHTTSKAHDVNYDEVGMDLSEDSDGSGKGDGYRSKPSEVKVEREREREKERKKERRESPKQSSRYRGRDEDRGRGEDRHEREREDDGGKERDDGGKYSRDRDDKYRGRERDRDDGREKGRYRDGRRGCRSRSRSSGRRKRSNSRDRGGKYGYSRRYEKANNKMAHLEKMGIEIKTPEGQAERTNEQKPGAVNEKNFFLPGVTGRLREQMERRKLLWQKKEPEKPATVAQPMPGASAVGGACSSKTGKVWEATIFAQDQDGKQASKFKRLMGIRESTSEQAKAVPDIVKKQEELFSTMEQQYEVARTATHTMRGVGLGFGSFQR